MKSSFGSTILNARTFLSNGSNLMGVLIAASLIVIAVVLLPVDSSFKAPAIENAVTTDAAAAARHQDEIQDRWMAQGSTATSNAPVSSTGADVLSDDWLRQRDATRDASPARIDEDVLGSP